MLNYKVFGYKILSDFEIPELFRTDETSYDFQIELANYEGSGHDTQRDFMRFNSASHLICNWALIGKFEILDRQRIVTALRPDCDPGLVRFPLLGAVMALLLQLNGKLVLHASSTVNGGRAATFLGDKGAGKSTTAAAMITAGHKLLSDDVVALTPVPTPIAYPAYPNVKLKPATAQTIGLKGEIRPKVIAPGLDKDQYIPSAPFNFEPVPATAFFMLTRGENLKADRQTSIEAFHQAMRFSYLRRFGTEVLKDGLGQEILSQCTELARRASFYRFQLPDDLNALPKAKEIVDEILSDH